MIDERALLIEEKKVLIDHYLNERHKLEQQVEELMKSISLISHRVDSFQAEIAKLETKERYLNSWTLAKKAEWVLKSIEKASSTRQIANNLILILEPELSRDSDLTSKLSATLKQKVDLNEVFKRYEDMNEIYYGLSEWFDPKGKILEKYRRERKFTLRGEADL